MKAIGHVWREIETPVLVQGCCFFAQAGTVNFYIKFITVYSVF